MPTKSPAQKRLMEAAAHTKGGYGGVPQSVGKEFVSKDAEEPMLAAANVLVAPDGHILLLKRSADETNYGGHWGLPGGKAENGESPEEAADRETSEETGYNSTGGNKKLLSRVLTPNGFEFHTFGQSVRKKFEPLLSDGEHSEFKWAPLHDLPTPLHPSVKQLLGKHGGHSAEDMSPKGWQQLASRFLEWIAEEADEPEHAADEAEVTDKFQYDDGDLEFIGFNPAPGVLHVYQEDGDDE